jgi:hypothetical protein
LTRHDGRGLDLGAVPYMILLIFVLIIGLVATCVLI